MRAEAVLDSAVFQLTPTRTRCELVIKSNGRTEKIASGLLNPFLSHLKTAKDQIEKGGYSIALEPDQRTDTSWFTKSTVERFVRFVSTPEILERVSTLELEIIQIEEGIALQCKEVSNSNSQVEDDLSKSFEYAGGNKPGPDPDASGRAIVLYKAGTPSPDSKSEKTVLREENSKVQLLRVLQARKGVLQKEQGMAFARAIAAGFTVENIADLISFAECFGAARLLEACSKFMDLYHGKHETGQWLEIDVADAISVRSEAAANTSGITISGDLSRQREPPWTGDPIIEGSNLKVNGRDITPDHPREARMNGEYYQGQFPHPMYAQWPVHSPPGMPIFQPYPPMQGMPPPFYPNYPPGGPFFAPPYGVQPEDSPHQKPKKSSKPKKRSPTSKSSTAADDLEDSQSQDDDDDVASDDDNSTATEDMNKEDSASKRGSRSSKKAGRSGGKKSGMVVIKNLNYITSKNRDKHDLPGSQSSDESDGAARRSSNRSESKDGSSSRRRGSRSSSGKPAERTADEEEEVGSRKDEAADIGRELADSGNWQVFQSFLLRDEDEEKRSSIPEDGGIFSSEKKPTARRRLQGGQAGEDLMLPLDRDSGLSSLSARRADDFENNPDSGSYARTMMSKNRAFNDDDNHHYSEGGFSRDVHLEVPFEETEVGRSGHAYRNRESEEFVIYGEHEKSLPNARHSSDPIAENEFETAAPLPKVSGGAVSSPSVVMSDESFIVPVRLGSSEQYEVVSRTAVILDSEFSPNGTSRELDPSSEGIKNPENYEPDDLSMMPEREIDGDYGKGGGYDPALDYEMEGQLCPSNAAPAVVEDDEQEVKNKEQKSLPKSVTGKKKLEPPSGRGRLSKLNPSAQAQARADKLRAYKADLQKTKKEKEEEAIRRVEALKLERQRRIAARSSGVSQPQSTTQPQKKTQSQPTSLGPNMPRASKFSDSPSAPSLLQQSKLPIRATSTAGSEPRRQATSSVVTRSASSLSTDSKKGLAVVGRSLSSLSDSRKDPSLPTVSSSQRSKQAPAPQSNMSRRTPDSSSTREKRNSGVILSSPAGKDVAVRSSSSNPTRGNRAAVSGETSKNLEQKVDNDAFQVVKENRGRIELPVGKGGDDSTVVEKIVVMLEHEAPHPPPVPAPPLQKEAELEHVLQTGNGLTGSAAPAKIEASPQHAAVRALPLPFVQSQVVISDTFAKTSQVSTEGEIVPEKAYEQLPPLKALLSRDGQRSEPMTGSEEGLASPSRMEEGFGGGEEDGEAVGKQPKSRESLKGLKKLLKLGRKSNAPASASEPDPPLSDDQQHPAANPSNNAGLQTSQAVVSQGEPPKREKSGSRHFSILSPFRGSKSGSDRKSSQA